MQKEYDTDALINLCQQVDLLEYACSNLEFKKINDDSYATHCPKHVDKTPSLFITPSKNLYYCFSCGRKGNILNWMRDFEGMSFNDAVDKLGKITGSDISNLKQCNCMMIFKQLKRLFDEKPKESPQRKILSVSELNKYENDIPMEWINEGISPEILKRYEIRIDNDSNRIIYPVYDRDENLIGFKGRTRYQNYKAIGVQKYMNYTKIGTTDFLTGWKYAKEYVIASGEIILFEGIKSCMKMATWGYYNSVSVETSTINMEQIKFIISKHIKNVVIAFDNDVDIKKINESIKWLKRFCNVFITQDVRKLLPENKMSPVDAGKDIWDQLYESRKKV